MPARKTPARLRKPLKVFISYAHEDRVYLDELLQHLALLKRQQMIEVWFDDNILPEAKMDPQIIEKLEGAHIVLMLVSAAFTASDYCYEKEMRRALQRSKAKKCLASWVLLSACQWHRTPLAKYKGLAVGNKAMPASRHERQERWREVADVIADYVERKTRPRSRKR